MGSVRLLFQHDMSSSSSLLSLVFVCMLIYPSILSDLCTRVLLHVLRCILCVCFLCVCVCVSGFCGVRVVHEAGSATLLEVARSLGSMWREGWRPRRTVRLCSWDAEEFGLIGSVEYVEDRQRQLTANAVAYLNV